jgi:hypothetical protein
LRDLIEVMGWKRPGLNEICWGPICAGAWQWP